MKPWLCFLKSPPALYVSCVYNSYFTIPTNCTTCLDMHLFMDPRLLWEWNLAIGHVYKIIVFYGINTH